MVIYFFYLQKFVNVFVVVCCLFSLKFFMNVKIRFFVVLFLVIVFFEKEENYGGEIGDNGIEKYE